MSVEFSSEHSKLWMKKINWDYECEGRVLFPNVAQNEGKKVRRNKVAILLR